VIGAKCSRFLEGKYGASARPCESCHIRVTVEIACSGWYSSNVDCMAIVHIAWPLCFEVVFPHKFAAGAYSNISVKNASEFGGRPNKSCSIA
jgi:hypothetical protein